MKILGTKNSFKTDPRENWVGKLLAQFSYAVRRRLPGAGVLFFLLMIVNAYASEINVERLANAIYLAEGSAKTSHPYGILTKYKVTTPRQACINTIKHALRDWNGKGDFIVFLGNRYCPVNCKNDNGTNKYWIKNVRFFYTKKKTN